MKEVRRNIWEGAWSQVTLLEPLRRCGELVKQSSCEYLGITLRRSSLFHTRLYCAASKIEWHLWTDINNRAHDLLCKHIVFVPSSCKPVEYVQPVDSIPRSLQRMISSGIWSGCEVLEDIVVHGIGGCGFHPKGPGTNILKYWHSGRGSETECGSLKSQVRT